jgi:hypothetical protein
MSSFSQPKIASNADEGLAIDVGDGVYQSPEHLKFMGPNHRMKVLNDSWTMMHSGFQGV